MTPFFVPAWLAPHRYAGRRWADLAPAEVADLRQRLQRFSPTAPEVSVVMPAWNEGDTLFRTLSALAATSSTRAVELVVVNNNSTDHTQQVLDGLGVRSVSEPRQGIAYARQRGLAEARGRYHLCADADTFYPPRWIDRLVRPLEQPAVACVYGRYAFVPPHPPAGRLSLWLYEQLTGALVQLRRGPREFINVLGFTMGFRTADGRAVGGFQVQQARVFDNAANVEESEDGGLALRLRQRGRLHLVAAADAAAFTSPRKVLRDGSLWQALTSRLWLHLGKQLQHRQPHRFSA